jgi:hypothetical protein
MGDSISLTSVGVYLQTPHGPTAWMAIYALGKFGVRGLLIPTYITIDLTKRRYIVVVSFENNNNSQLESRD